MDAYGTNVLSELTAISRRIVTSVSSRVTYSQYIVNSLRRSRVSQLYLQ